MENFSRELENVLIERPEKMSLGQIWDNQPPAMHWCLGLTCLNFGFIYMFLCTML